MQLRSWAVNLNLHSQKSSNMTESQIQLVKESWGKVVPIATQAGEMFYGRLLGSAAGKADVQ